MKITSILDRPIAYHRVFVTLTGSVKAAILLSQAVYWQPRATQKDGYWYKTAEEWQEETGLTSAEQRTARKDCEKYLKSDLRGIPATLFYKVDEDALMKDLLSENPKTSFAESEELVNENLDNINKNTETTTENTQVDSSNSQTNTAYNRGDQERPDKVTEYLKMINFPGAKLEAKIDATLSYLAVSLTRNTHTKEWREFAKYIISEHKKNGWQVETFVKWLLSQKGYDPQYWSVKKMQEFYPQAFTSTKDEEMTRLL